MPLEIRPVDDDEDAETWREVHNAVIRAHPLSAADVRERRGRNHLTVAFVDGRVVGNATVRPASGDGEPPVVIVRVLPESRRRGFGTEYFRRLMAEDSELRGGGDVATIVLVANTGGVPFAVGLGFVETGRYEVDGAEYADLVRRA